MASSIKIFARIGELMQGILPDRSPFLVSGLPSRLFFSEATIDVDAIVSARRTYLPPKAQLALDLFARRNYRPIALPPIRLRSNIPPGKGLSSSSADILSVLYLANDFCEAGLTDEDIYSLATRVEPTDPCLSDEIVVFRQHTGAAEGSLRLPPLTMLYFDAAPEQQVDTLSLRRHYDHKASGFFQSLLHRFLQAAERGNYPALFDCITHSALYNQTVMPLPRFEEYHRLAIRMQSGLMIAHSGTIMGLLMRPEQTAELLPIVETMANHYTRTEIYKEQYFSPVL